MNQIKKIVCENWKDNIIQSSLDNKQGKELVINLLKEQLTETNNIEFDVQVEEYRLNKVENPSKHLIVQINYKLQKQYVKTQQDQKFEVSYNETLDEIGTKYLNS